MVVATDPVPNGLHVRFILSIGIAALCTLQLSCTRHEAEPPAQSAVNEPVETVGAGGTSQTPGSEWSADIDELRTSFNTMLLDPTGMWNRVRDETSAFPEGDLFLLVYAAAGYVNLALAGELERQHAERQARTLLEMAVRATERVVDVGSGELLLLEDYRGFATYLGQLNLGLSVYALVGEDEALLALNSHLSHILHAALSAQPASVLQSYPELRWPFDTIPVLVSLHLYDERNGTERSAGAIREHLEWVRSQATDPETALPYSWISEDGRRTEVPRGCDLGLRISLIGHLDPQAAGQLYAEFVEHFWIQRWFGAGFAEWPLGSSDVADADSGPVVLGIGFAASGFGIAAAKATSDHARLRALTNALTIVSSLLRGVASISPSSGQDLLQLSADYRTGFLLGDALLFYGLTWQRWSKSG
jgi:hypothetical protein